MADAADPTLPDLAKPRRIHVVGAGGSGMSAIATVLASMGHTVTGSDATDSPALRRLTAHGVVVTAGHDPTSTAAADMVVRSTAVPDSDTDVVAAASAGVRVWRRADLLAAICRQKRTVAVSGTHGKTTTSSMLAVAMRALGMHPSMIIGGDIKGLGTGAAWDAAGEWFVVEADESDGTFVELGAEAAVVTSVEADHLEFYGGMGALVAAFERFVAEPSGPVVLCADDPGAAALAAARPAGRPLHLYGTSSGADFVISGIESGRSGAAFRLALPGGGGVDVALAVPGVHNVRNAAGVVSLLCAMGCHPSQAAAAVAEFQGVGRRFEGRGEAGGVTFVDGYDHLPTEVAAAVATGRAGGWARVMVVFQPHRYSRTESIGSSFGDAFVDADSVVVTGIYSAGEAPRPGITGEIVAEAVRRAHPDADVTYVEDLDAAEEVMAARLRPGDLCLTLGAGDITTLPDRLMARMGERP